MARRTVVSQPGFTLLEVLVTILLFTIGMLGTLVLTTGVMRGNFFSKNITTATAIAQTTLEGAQKAGYAVVDAFVADSSKVPPNVAAGGVNFSQTATAVSGLPASGMKTISVIVSWNEANNAPRTVNLETILAQ